RQRKRRRQRQPEARAVGANAAVEEDEAQRRAADEIGGPDVLEREAALPLAEGDAADALLADQHTEAEKDEEHGRADAARELAGEDAGQQQETAKQQPSMG